MDQGYAKKAEPTLNLELTLDTPETFISRHP
jgi:hypothetical protein